jgi:hypothetical protein
MNTGRKDEGSPNLSILQSLNLVIRNLLIRGNTQSTNQPIKFGIIRVSLLKFACAGRMVRANPQLKPQGREAQSLPPGINEQS